MIKKAAVIFVLIGLFFGYSYAQKIQWGLTFGGSKVDIKSEFRRLYNNDDFVNSYGGGIIVNYSFLNMLSVHSGILISRIDFDGTFSSWGPLPVLTPMTMKITYMEFPLMIRLFPFKYIFIGLGPYVSVKIAGEFKANNQEMDVIKGGEVGYILGSGIHFPLFGKKHFIEIRYTRGITPVFIIFEGEKYYTAAFSCRYGILF